ncbi:hypothetical protein GPECTOR_63g63 [Gonium pectorale]|uniref:GH16 domain-containing protein n=1 Tax=Gonium pectorale TaxID=33097 RepID=A0A150G4J1_GONPE|nr:hypothetical protein GPECTOR_63g63 [Gonium pectorale]|eukprot:KXZ44738.1 hypothetical protein GPECTOR_63g63 [Gonium pectorale]
MVLVFSDEFNSRWRDFGPGKDAKWQALDLLYVNGDAAMFRSSAVSVNKRGCAVITASKTPSAGPFSAPWGDQPAEAAYTSGMLQGWNKFCFTVFTLGNLGRAGYLRSTDGRGAPEIDLFEVGVWQANKPQLSTSIHVAPILPLGMHWLDYEGGTYYPTYSDPTLHSAPNGWAGINSYMRNGLFMPRPGTRLADALSATHDLNASHFRDFYVYGFDWQPRKYIRWYINDILIYEINADALQGGQNGNNETIGERLIPVEPSYININLAMSNSFAPIHPDIPLPSAMEIDYIRIYQARSEINIGCDTPDYPSQDYINANVNKYKVTLAGYEDFVGDSRVMGPTMEPPPPDHTTTIVAVVCSVCGFLLLVACGVGFWLWRRKKKAQEAADAEAGKQPSPPGPSAMRRCCWVVQHTLLAFWYGPGDANRRHPVSIKPKVLPVVSEDSQRHIPMQLVQPMHPMPAVQAVQTVQPTPPRTPIQHTQSNQVRIPMQKTQSMQPRVPIRPMAVGLQ